MEKNELDNNFQSTPPEVIPKGHVGFRRNTRACTEIIVNKMGEAERVKFDTKKLIRKIMLETGESERTAKIWAQQLSNIKDKELYSVAVAWANGIQKSFVLKEKGITLEEVKKKHKSPHVVAILTMDTFMKKPDFIQTYHSLQYRR